MQQQKLTGEALIAWGKEQNEKDEKPVQDAKENVAALRALVKEVCTPKKARGGAWFTGRLQSLLSRLQRDLPPHPKPPRA